MKAWPFLVFVASTLLLVNAFPAFAQGQATIVIRDYQGINPLPGAKLVIADSASPEDRREFTADENGVVAVGGIDPGTEYIVEVYWSNPDYGSEEVLVFQRGVQGSVLQTIKEIRVHVFNVEVMPTDKDGNLLSMTLPPWIELEEEAVAYLDGVKRVDREMPFTAGYALVPQGRHRLRIDWLGYTVYDGEVEIGLETLEGYIPGVDDPSQYDEAMREVMELWVETNTAKLDITVTDPDGNPVTTSIDIIDPRGLYKGLAILVRYQRGGHVVFGQFPMVEYTVMVQGMYNIPEILAEAKCIPGQPCTLVLDPSKGPYYILKVRTKAKSGVPLEGVDVELSGWRETTDADGIATFTCVRPGTYILRALIGENEVYPAEAIEVTESTEIEITVEVEGLNVDINLVTEDGRPYEVYWSLDSETGAHFDSGGKPSSKIVIENLPPGTYELKIVIPEYELEYRLGSFSSGKLIVMKEFKLPIGDTRVRLLTPDEKPGVGYLVKLCLKEVNICFEKETDEDGDALFENLPWHRVYNLTIFSGEAPVLMGELNISFALMPLTLPGEAPPAPPETPAATTITKTITQTVTTTKEVTVTATQTATQTATREVTNTITKTATETETKIVEKEVLPALPISIAIVAAAAIIAAAIAVTRLKKPAS